MGITLILAGVPEQRAVPFGTGLEMAGGVGCVVFAVTWGVIAYYAFQRQRWAIRTGFWFSLIFATAIICGMFSEIVAAGEWSALSIVIVAVVASIWLHHDESKIRPLLFAVISASLGFMFYRSYSSEHSEVVSTAIRHGSFLACMEIFFWPYLKSCRALWNNPSRPSSSFDT